MMMMMMVVVMMIIIISVPVFGQFVSPSWFILS
jgi:hypothetical protein